MTEEHPRKEQPPQKEQTESTDVASTPENKAQPSSTSTNVNSQIADLKQKLNELNEEKEKWYAKRETLSKTIKEKIGTIKNSATTRNSLTASVKEQKATRRELNKKIIDKIKIVKELQAKQQKVTSDKKEERKESPEGLKRQIAALERQVETEGLKFEKEKKVMKEIKTLKKKYAAVKETQGSWGRIKDLSKEITALKKEADSIHKGVQETAGVSQEKHQTLISTSKNIDDLKKQEREAHNKFINIKKEFTKYNDQLKALVPEMKRMKFARDQDRKQKEKKKEASEKQTIAEKVQKVEEKLNSGKKVKLTMEDLLAFQAKKE